MSDENTPGVRRFGRKDRKQRLDTAGPLFPDDVSLPGEESAPSLHTGEIERESEEAEPIPFDQLAATPDEIDAALSAVSALDVLTGNVRAQQANPNAITEERFPERFPPIRPESAAAPKSAPQTRKRGIARQDLIAAVFFLATIGMAVWVITIWRDPYSTLNPLPPPTTFREVTATVAPQVATNIPTLGPTASFTPLLESVIQGDATDFPTPTLAPVNVLEPTPSPYPFILAETGVIYTPNSNGRGCDWSSIAGTVTGLNGEALNNYGIEIVGENSEDKVFSGTAQTFGPGGFELFLNGVPQQAQYMVQLFSSAGAPLSDKFTVVTSADCQQNVAIVNFVQQKPI